ncbi:hypothetical protein Pcinc_019164 [Petrolisthes cinctipes]|uniref:Uncharacterized protein n=1 Tax=Petrolisthes cinctipes TaxID=88211 RepID=A0AAE1KLX3_PETCI|nr:hypothetical protein Pcinc_019164 [Petrolisthes cinctipes]
MERRVKRRKEKEKTARVYRKNVRVGRGRNEGKKEGEGRRRGELKRSAHSHPPLHIHLSTSSPFPSVSLLPSLPFCLLHLRHIPLFNSFRISISNASSGLTPTCASLQLHLSTFYFTPLSLPPSTFPPYLRQLFLPTSVNFSSLPPSTFPPYLRQLFLPTSLNFSSLPPSTFPPYLPQLFLPTSLNFSSLPPSTFPPYPTSTSHSLPHLNFTSLPHLNLPLPTPPQPPTPYPTSASHSQPHLSLPLPTQPQPSTPYPTSTFHTHSTSPLCIHLYTPSRLPAHSPILRLSFPADRNPTLGMEKEKNDGRAQLRELKRDGSRMFISVAG